MGAFYEVWERGERKKGVKKIFFFLLKTKKRNTNKIENRKMWARVREWARLYVYTETYKKKKKKKLYFQKAKGGYFKTEPPLLLFLELFFFRAYQQLLVGDNPPAFFASDLPFFFSLSFTVISLAY